MEETWALHCAYSEHTVMASEESSSEAIDITTTAVDIVYAFTKHKILHRISWFQRPEIARDDFVIVSHKAPVLKRSWTSS